MGMKRLAVLSCFLVSPCFLLSYSEAAPLPPIKARSAMLMDFTDGRVLYEQNPDVLIAPASLTKVLTLYLVHEAIEEGRLSPWEMVTVSREAAARGGSRMGLRAGDQVPVAELIKGMAVASGNDACVAIAEHMCGSVERFVQLMNRKAAQLGMTHTVFRTADGLPAEGQVTTARDMAKLSTAYLKRFPYALDVHSMQSYTYRGSTHRNANRLLATYPGADGLKTGFVCASGYNFIATANRGDHRLVAVVLGAPSPGVRAAETAKLINHGYASLGIELPPVYLAKQSGADGVTRTGVQSSKRLRTLSRKPPGKPTNTVAVPTSLPGTAKDRAKMTPPQTGSGSTIAAAGAKNPSRASPKIAQVHPRTIADQKSARATSSSGAVQNVPAGVKKTSLSAVAPSNKRPAGSASSKTLTREKTPKESRPVSAACQPEPAKNPAGKKSVKVRIGGSSVKKHSAKTAEKPKPTPQPAALKSGGSPRKPS